MFNIDNFIVDRVLYGWAESLTGEILYTLKQISNAQVQIDADTKDQTDANNQLVKRFYKNKSGTLTIDSTLLTFTSYGHLSGSDVAEANQDNQIEMPRFVKIGSGESVQLTSPILDTVVLYSTDVNGNLGEAYNRGVTASETEYSISSDNVLTAPTIESDDAYFVVKYQRMVDNGVRITNRGNRFPKTVCLTLKVVGIQPCEPDHPKIVYLQFPNFQPSPETTVDFNTEGTVSYTGFMFPNVCDGDHEIYSVYAISEAEEGVGYYESGLKLVALNNPGAKYLKFKVDPLKTENNDQYSVNTYLNKFLKDNYSFT